MHGAVLKKKKKGRFEAPGQGISNDLLNGQESGGGAGQAIGGLTMVYASTHFYRASRVICFLLGLAAAQSTAGLGGFRFFNVTLNLHC